MIVSLTGFMGSGKSSVGRILAEKLGWRFTDLDAYIVHKKGMSIAEIFSSEGEESFRALEAECLRDNIIMSNVSGENLVLALGGGTMMTGITRGLLLGETVCVYLKASVETLEKRLNGTADRPLLKERGIRDLLSEREAVYETAPLTVCADPEDPEAVAEEVKNSISRIYSVTL